MDLNFILKELFQNLLSKLLLQLIKEIIFGKGMTIQEDHFGFIDASVPIMEKIDYKLQFLERAQKAGFAASSKNNPPNEGK